MKKLLAAVLAVATVLSVCTFATSAATLTPADGKSNFSIYRLANQPKLDGVVSAGEYYVLAGTEDYATDSKSKKALYAGYDDTYLYLAAQVECKGHVNSWYQTQDGMAAPEGTDIYNGHSLTLGLTYENPIDGDEIKAYTEAGNISWSAAYETFAARLATFALTDNFYRYKCAYNYDWFDSTWGVLNYKSFYNLLGSDYQLSSTGWTHRGNGEGDDFVYVDAGTGGTIRYNTPYIAENSSAADTTGKSTPYSQKLFAVSHNGYMGNNIHDTTGSAEYDAATGKYAHAMNGEEESAYAYALWGDEEKNTTDGIDTYEIMVPWEWIDYRVSDKRKDKLADKNQYDYETYSALNVRQQQLKLGTRTTDGSLWYTFNKTNGGFHENAATEACDKTVDGTYFGLFVDLVTGGDATALKAWSDFADDAKNDYYKQWCEYYESYYSNDLGENIVLGTSQAELSKYSAIFLAGDADSTAALSGDNTIAASNKASNNGGTTTTASGNTTTTAGASGNSSTNKTTAKGNSGTTSTTGGKSTETGDATLPLLIVAVLAGAAVTVLTIKKKRI